MDFHLPEIGEGVYEAELVAWLVKVGDKVQRGQSLMEVLTDKATMEIPSPFSGTITELRAAPGQPVKVGDVVLTVSGAEQTEAAEKPAAMASARAPAEKKPLTEPARRQSDNGPLMPSRQGLPVKAAPSVRYLARKLGVDLAQVSGSGPEGRILIEDLSSRLQAAEAGVSTNRKARPERPPDYGKPGTRIKLHGLRRKIAEHMVRSKQTIPHYTYVDECDVTALTQLRQSLRDHFARSGIKLTYLAFFVKAVVSALQEVPIVNASLNETDGEIVLHDRYHIGIAVAAPAGLIVPVIRDADRKPIAEIAREIDRLSVDARAGKSRLEDLRGGTFTITSIGGVGGLIATPIINHPEVGILGIGKIVKRPVFDATGNVRPAEMVYLSLSFDHRVLDGAVGAVFGNAIIRHLQHPAALLLPEKLG
jgi:pyruvate dehydrogenase E2 component (dihydrolipoamide acetyltransferase)/2-oxoisovalerate dehydrogenase E2 component (dihydrolipoyl transacylase)